MSSDVLHRGPPLPVSHAAVTYERKIIETFKMAESVGSMHFAANGKINPPKPLVPKIPPESRPQSSNDVFPPPPKKVRIEEKSLKQKKLNGDVVCAGEKHNGKQSYGSPAKWSFGPAKPSNSTSPAPARKIFKISNFLASPAKVKKPNEKRHKEKEKSAKTQSSLMEKVNPGSCHTKTENGETACGRVNIVSLKLQMECKKSLKLGLK